MAANWSICTLSEAYDQIQSEGMESLLYRAGSICHRVIQRNFLLTSAPVIPTSLIIPARAVDGALRELRSTASCGTIRLIFDKSQTNLRTPICALRIWKADFFN